MIPVKPGLLYEPIDGDGHYRILCIATHAAAHHTDHDRDIVCFEAIDNHDLVFYLPLCEFRTAMNLVQKGIRSDKDPVVV